MKLPRRTFLYLAAGAAASQPSREWRGHKPIRRGRSGSSFLFLPVVHSTSSDARGRTR